MDLIDIIKKTLAGVTVGIALAGCGGMNRHIDPSEDAGLPDAYTDSDVVEDGDVDSDVALPDVPATCTLRSNAADVETISTLTTVSFDTLENAGVDSIRLYEDGAQIGGRTCGGDASCIHTMPVIHGEEGTHTYHAECEDIGGNVTESNSVRVHFEGGEELPECADGVDNDGDGTADFDAGRVEFSARVLEGETITADFRGFEYEITNVVVGDDHDPIESRISLNGYYITFEAGGEYAHPDGTTLIVDAIHAEPAPGSDYVDLRLFGDGSDRGCTSMEDDETGEADICSVIDPVDVELENNGVSGFDPLMGDFGCYASAGMPPYMIRLELDTGESRGGDRYNSGFGSSWTFFMEYDHEYTLTCVVTDSCGEVAVASDILPAVSGDPCDDGLDNDGDGRIDLDDVGCTGATDESETVDINDLYEILIDGDTFTGQLVVGDDAPPADIIGVTDIAVHIQYLRMPRIAVGSAVLASTVADPYAEDLVVVGNECVNSVTAELLGVVYPTCGAGQYAAPGEAVIMSFEHGDHFAYVIMGHDAEMTTLATRWAAGAGYGSGDGPYNYELGTEYRFFAECADGIDNDGDGLVDMDDPFCESPSDNSEEDPMIVPECSDGIDNDGDGLVDMLDPGCSDPGDPDETDDPCSPRTPVLVELVWTPEMPVEGEEISFLCISSGGVGSHNYYLEPGDGSAYSSNDPTHTYDYSGIYSAFCVAMDACGTTGMATADITVANNPPIANLMVDRTTGTAPVEVNYECVTGAGNPPFTYDIDFDGDGIVDSITPTGTFVYTTPGTYTMSCTVMDNDGDIDTDFVSIIVE